VTGKGDERRVTGKGDWEGDQKGDYIVSCVVKDHINGK